MDDRIDNIAVWMAKEIIPHERAVARWLARRWSRLVDVEDVIQEAYCRIAGLESVDHINNPAAYFFRTAHSVVSDLMRRAGVINFTSMTQIEWSNVMDDEPLADRVIAADQEYERVSGLLSELSDMYRQVIELRRIEGLNRKETAARLGVSENDVKNCLVRGLQKVTNAMVAQDILMDADEPKAAEVKVAGSDQRRPA